METLESEFVTFFKVDKDVSLSIAMHTLQKAAKNLKIRIDEARNTGDMFQAFRSRRDSLISERISSQATNYELTFAECTRACLRWEGRLTLFL